MAFFEEFIFSGDATAWLLLGLALLIVILFVEDPESLFGFVDFPVHEYLKPAAYVVVGFVAVNFVLPIIASMGALGLVAIVGIIAFAAQSALNATLEEGIAAGLISLLFASPLFGF